MKILISKYLFFVYYKDFLKKIKKNIKKYLNFLKKFKYCNIKNGNVSISKENFNIIKKTLKRFIKSDVRGFEIAKFFLEADLIYKKKQININNISEFDPILICVEKDDFNKVEKLYDHYCNIGVKYFVFIDNESTDGTIDFLERKKNVDIICCHSKYYTTAREAWLNRIIGHYGYNRWYLIVDSDEMFNYIGSENEKINEHIKKLAANGITRELSLMLDMYSKEGAFEETKDFTKKYKYFDSNSYEIRYNNHYTMITGGPRKRVFSNKNFEKDFMLGKYPLINFKKGDLQSNSHFPYPYYKNIYKECTSVLMHYKFIGTLDIQKYKKRIEEKNYYNGSQEYKLYIQKYEDDNNINFYNEDSVEFINSNSLSKINILNKL